MLVLEGTLVDVFLCSHAMRTTVTAHFYTNVTVCF